MLSITNRNVPETIKEFLEMFYLSFPHEVRARVQQAYSEIKSDIEAKKLTTPQDIQNAIQNTEAYKDAVKMVSYSAAGILKVDPIILNEFIKQFTSYHKVLLKKHKGITTEPTIFFNHWVNIIRFTGKILLNKIYKTPFYEKPD